MRGQVYIFLGTTRSQRRERNGDKILAVVNYQKEILCKYLRSCVRTRANTFRSYISPAYTSKNNNKDALHSLQYVLPSTSLLPLMIIDPRWIFIFQRDYFKTYRQKGICMGKNCLVNFKSLSK